MRVFEAVARRIALLAPVLISLMGVGCAHNAARFEGAGERHSRKTAQTYYLAGEAAYAKQNFARAAALWKRAVVELPPRPGYDDLRHKLMLRAGHGQLMAYASSQQPIYLEEGVAMLEAYAAKHEALMGDGEQARRERENVYELIGEMEVAREDHGEKTQAVAAAVETAPANVEVVQVEVASADPKAPRDGITLDVHEGEVLDHEQGMSRDIRVRGRGRLADINDPETRAKLRSDFVEANTGPVLTRAGVIQFEPRGLVRLLSRPVPSMGPADREHAVIGREALAAARPGLEACYEQFIAAAGPEVAMAFTIVVQDQGVLIDADVSSGTLGSPEADVCALEAWKEVHLFDRSGGLYSIEVPVLFFLHTPKPMLEATHQPFGPTDRPNTANTAGPGNLTSDRSQR